MSWSSWFGRTKGPRNRKRKVARPALEILEDRQAPAAALTNLQFSPNTTLQGVPGTLTGNIVGHPVGSLSVQVNWGDGSAPQVVPLAIDATSISIPHTFTGLPPGQGGVPVTITATLQDAGPSIITNADAGGYSAYDTPFTNFDLTTNPAFGPGPPSFDFWAPPPAQVVPFNNPVNDSVAIPLGADTFRFYGNSYTGPTSLYVSTNGLISLGVPDINPINNNLLGQAQGIIAPLWTGLQLGSGQVLYTFEDLDANLTDNWLVVEWQNVQAVGGSAPVTFQAMLQLNSGPSNGDIVFNYPNTVFGNPALDNGQAATVGIAAAHATFNGKVNLVQENQVTDFVHSGQAMYFSTQVLNPASILSNNGQLDGAGYAADPSPFLSNFDLSTGAFVPPSPIQFIPSNQTGTFTILGTNDTFTFYGATENLYWVGTNGMITFGAPFASGNNTALNAVNAPTMAALAPLWTNLTTGPVGGVYATEISLDGVSNQFAVFEWSTAPHVNVAGTSPNGVTFEAFVELNTGAANGNIFFNYTSTNFGDFNNNGATATVGIKDGGTNVAQVSYNNANAALMSGKAIAIMDRQSTALTSVTVDVGPTIPIDVDPTANTVVEGAGGGTPVGITAQASNSVFGPITYSLSSNPGGVFAIDPNTGVVTVAAGQSPDYDASGGSYTITVTATDTNGLTSSANFTIAVTDPPLTAVTNVYSGPNPNQVPAGAATGTLVGITAFAYDAGSAPVTYSILNPSGAFAVDPITGVVTVANGNLISYANNAPNYQISVTVTASDGAAGNTISQTFTINILFEPPFIVDIDPAPNQVAEGTTSGPVGITVYAAYPGGPFATNYILTSDGGGRFIITPTISASGSSAGELVGVISVNPAGPLISYATASKYNLVVEATLADGLNLVTVFTVNVINLPPSVPINVANPNPSVSELAKPGTPVGITAFSTDPGGAVVHYSLTSNPGNRFAINAVTGVVTVSTTGIGEYFSAAPLTITVRASDGHGGFSYASFPITITHPANEGPEGPKNHIYQVIPGNVLTVSAATGLLQGLVNYLGGPVTLVGLVTRPPGTLNVNFSTGAFTYLAPPNVHNINYTFVYKAKNSAGYTTNFTVILEIGSSGKLDGF